MGLLSNNRRTVGKATHCGIVDKIFWTKNKRVPYLCLLKLNLNTPEHLNLVLIDLSDSANKPRGFGIKSPSLFISELCLKQNSNYHLIT